MGRRTHRRRADATRLELRVDPPDVLGQRTTGGQSVRSRQTARSKEANIRSKFEGRTVGMDLLGRRSLANQLAEVLLLCSKGKRHLAKVLLSDVDSVVLANCHNKPCDQALGKDCGKRCQESLVQSLRSRQQSVIQYDPHS